jgi:hypothetical protein
MSDFNIGDTVVVVAKVDNYQCQGVIESIDESKREPIKVTFAEDTREDDDYSGFCNWACYKQSDLKLIKRGE